ncbi:oxidoreductase, partial [Streptomyces chartreusis]
RGDAGTVAAHVSELRRHAPQTVAGYLAMARATADRALAHGLLKPELAEDLLGVLANGTSGSNGTNGAEGDAR